MRTLVDGLVDGVRRIAVVRANALGDLVFALPALDALRRAYRSAEITLVGRPHHAELLGGRPSPVDRIEVAPPYGGVTADEGVGHAGPEVDHFFARMRERRFDLALQLHGGGANSTPFTKRLGARLTAGLRARGAPPLDRWVRYTYFQHEVLRYLEAVALVGADPPPSLEPALAVTPADRHEADALLASSRPAPVVGPESEPAGTRPAKVAVLNPGATDARRRWPTDRFAAVGRALTARGFAVVVTGDAGDAGRSAAIVDGVGGPCRSLAGATSLGGLLGVLERATVVVSNDTGPLHLARAVGTPTVGIYWCGNALTGGPLSTHLHRPLLSWRTRCPVCGVDCMADRCPHDAPFVTDVPVDAVLAELDDLLDLVETPAVALAGIGRRDA